MRAAAQSGSCANKFRLFPERNFDPYGAESIERIVDVWLPYVFAINNVNRAMGRRDLYPFVQSRPVIGKLGFIHALVHDKA